MFNAAAHAGSQFASTPSPYLYADDLQDSFVGIAAVRLLPGASTTSKNRISLRLFLALMHISIRTSADTTLSVSPASPQDLQTDPACRKTFASENPAHREFRIIMLPDRDDPDVETPFIISFPPKYTARSPFGRATRPMLAFNMETREIVFLKIIGERMWTV